MASNGNATNVIYMENIEERQPKFVSALLSSAINIPTIYFFRTVI